MYAYEISMLLVTQFAIHLGIESTFFTGHTLLGLSKLKSLLPYIPAKCNLTTIVKSHSDENIGSKGLFS